MAVHIVTYDLHKQGQNYSCIKKKLEAYTTHWHMQGSVWIIETSETPEQLRDNLLECLDGNDKLFVAELSGPAAWYGYSAKGDKWLQNRLEPLCR